MSTQGNKLLVQQLFSYFGSGDIQSLLTLLSPDVEWSLPHITEVPVFCTYKGREEVLNLFYVDSSKSGRIAI
jgi:ketosteroid isomerase-like protein